MPLALSWSTPVELGLGDGQAVSGEELHGLSDEERAVMQAMVDEQQFEIARQLSDAWLDRAIAASTARWKVVYGHHQVYSATRLDNPRLIRDLVPLLDHRVDVYLCGHDHNLQALKSDGGVRFFVAGGGGVPSPSVTVPVTAPVASSCVAISNRIASDPLANVCPST